MLYYDRATVCVSSQVGCAMGCVFCATGQMGFTRNLSPGEIVEQVLVFSRWLRQHPYHRRPPAPPRPPAAAAHPAAARPPPWAADRRPAPPVPMRGRRRPPACAAPAPPAGPPPAPPAPPRPLDAVTNVVFMGMGEPLLNYDNLWQAIHTLNSPDALVLGARRMTVSTVGVVPRIRRFTHEDLAVNLAISLHAPNDALRSRLVPLNEKYPLADLMAACREYIARDQAPADLRVRADRGRERQPGSAPTNWAGCSRACWCMST